MYWFRILRGICEVLVGNAEIETMESRLSSTDVAPPKRARTRRADAEHDTIDLTGSPSPPHGTSSAKRADPSTKAPLGFRLTKLQDAPGHHNEFAIGLKDLLEGDFSQCLLTNYMYDVPWLLRECPRLEEVPVLLVHGERDHTLITEECRALKNVTLIAPRLPIPYGTHHTKMMIVIYATFIRVMICTANFIPIDWNNKTQGVWTQDFPLKTASLTRSEPAVPEVDFEQDLTDYLRKLGKPVADFCARVHDYDFRTAKVALVPSVPGVYTGKDIDKYGHMRVRKLLHLLNLSARDHPLVCQFSSMGSLDEKWLFGEFTQSLMPGFTSSEEVLPVKSFHIIWPAVEDVRNSREGWNAGRAVPCPLKNMKPFLHKYLRKWTPPNSLYRQNAMPHMKSYARIDPSQNGHVDWAILTSSNLSKAAWGSLQKNRTQFMVRSYELGVLFLPDRKSSEKSPKQTQLTIFGSDAESTATTSCVLPLPYGLPIKTYDPRVDEPWVWDLVRDSPDVFGNCYIPR